VKLREGFGEDADIREQLHIGGMASIWADHIGPPLPNAPEGDIIDYRDIEHRDLPYETAIYYEQSVWPLRDATSSNDLESYRWPVADRFDDSRIEGTARSTWQTGCAPRLHDAIHAGEGGHVL